MASPDPNWTINHFTQGNPEGPGQDSVPALLRRVADTLDALGPITVQDLVFQTEITADEDRPSVTVYYHRQDRPA